MRSTLRRNAITTPASVHCMSRQLMFSDLSCTGFRRKIWHPRHHCLVTIMCSSWNFWIPCSSWNFWILWSYRFGPSRQLPDSESPDSGIASNLFSLGFLYMLCALFSLCATVQSRYSESLNSFWTQASIFLHSNLCGTCDLCHHTTQ